MAVRHKQAISSACVFSFPTCFDNTFTIVLSSILLLLSTPEQKLRRIHFHPEFRCEMRLSV
jgi:hypothetical protein